MGSWPLECLDEERRLRTQGKRTVVFRWRRDCQTAKQRQGLPSRVARERNWDQVPKALYPTAMVSNVPPFFGRWESWKAEGKG